MRKAEDSNPTPVKTHTRFERGLAPSPGHLPDARAEDRLRARGDAEGGGLEPHTWRCPPGSSRRRRLAGSPSIVVQGGNRTRTPARAPRFERGVSTVPSTWTSQCPGRESNSHARLERRLLRPVCLPVVPPPGRERGARGEGRTRMGREARWPLEPVCLPGNSTTRAKLRESDSNRRPPGYEPGDLPPDLSRDEHRQSRRSVPGGTRTPDLLVRNQAL